MRKVILICGKICSGKSYYAKRIQTKCNAVILSADEATYELIDNEQGEFYNIFIERVKRYLRKKAVEIVRAGADVILDWGFWTSMDRTDIAEYFRANGVSYEWHYMDIADEAWHRNINTRNAAIKAGNGGPDFYVDEGLLYKLSSVFEEPAREEMDVWVLSGQ